MKTVILVTTFNRDRLLYYGLKTLQRQDLKDVEIVVLNDGLPCNVERICAKAGVRYIYTGHRNEDNEFWRVPGFAFNIGVKETESDNIILTCAEIFHVDDCVQPVVNGIAGNKICIPTGKDDHDSSYLDALGRDEPHSDSIYNNLNNLKTELPFMLGVTRKRYCEIGGYDEDFIGQSYDDDDFVGRLLGSGCGYLKLSERIVHLYHTRKFPSKSQHWRLAYNRDLYNKRKGQIIRNTDIEWGVL